MINEKLVKNIFSGLEFKTIEGVQLATIPSHTFDGEYDKRSIGYVIAVWLASVWSMVTNMITAFIHKIRNPRKRLLKILWEMGRSPEHISCFSCDRLSRYNHQAKVGAAGWKSLDLFYNYHEKIKPRLNNDLEGHLTRFWIGKMENRQAVTNRYKICVSLLVDAFRRFKNEREIRLLSIASGSAQAVIAAIRQCTELNIKIVLIDADLSAVKESKKLVQEAGFDDRFAFVRGTTGRLESVCETFKPHIVEMVGFLDYRPDHKAKQLISRIKSVLPDNGIFITCNIRKNREKLMLDWLLLWPMIYRCEKQFAVILKGGGFQPEMIRILYEPFKIHGIAVCQK